MIAEQGEGVDLRGPNISTMDSCQVPQTPDQDTTKETRRAHSDNTRYDAPAWYIYLFKY